MLKYDTDVVGDRAAIVAGLAAAGIAPSNGSYNLNRKNLRVWSKALGRVRRNEGRAVVALRMDSTGVGYGTGTGSFGLTGARPFGMPQQLANALSSMGLPASADSWFGSHGLSSIALITGYDTRLTFGAGWSLSTQNSLGGVALENVSGTDLMTLAPVGPFGTVNIYYACETGYGDFDILIDGVKAGATVAMAGSGVLGTATRTVTHGVHTISLQRTGTGGRLQVLGIDPYRTDISVVSILDTPWSGSRTNSWMETSKFYSNGSILQTYIKPDLTITNLGINDRSTSNSAATYSSNIGTILDRDLLGPSSCLLCNPTDTDSDPGSLKAPYLAALQAQSLAKSVPLFDLTDWIGSYASQTADYYDGLHPKKDIYGAVAAGYATAMLGMGLN